MPIKRVRRVISLSLPEAKKVAQVFGLGVTKFPGGNPNLWRIGKYGSRRGGIVYDSFQKKKRIVGGNVWREADDVYAVMAEALIPKIKTEAKKLGLPVKKVAVVF